MDFKKFFMIDSFVTPHVIRFIYWLAQALIIIAGFAAMFTGSSPYGRGMNPVLSGILILTLGSLVLRIYIELLIIIFRIAEDLREIRNMKKNDNKPL